MLCRKRPPGCDASVNSSQMPVCFTENFILLQGCGRLWFAAVTIALSLIAEAQINTPRHTPSGTLRSKITHPKTHYCTTFGSGNDFTRSCVLRRLSHLVMAPDSLTSEPLYFLQSWRHYSYAVGTTTICILHEEVSERDVYPVDPNSPAAGPRQHQVGHNTLCFRHRIYSDSRCLSIVIDKSDEQPTSQFHNLEVAAA